MTKEQLYEGIGLSAAAREFVNEYQMTRTEYDEWKKLFYEDPKAFMKKGTEQEGNDFSQKSLVLGIYMALDVYDEFKSAGYSDIFYYQNMRDIAIWNAAHEKKYGIPGLKEIMWVGMSLKQKLYRIGRLQFEPYRLEQDILVCGKLFEKGTEVLNVHIPEDGRLDPSACDEAFQEAVEFYKERNYAGAETFICESWLLSPELKKIMDEKSNIIRFQERFHVYDVVYPFRQTEERVFGMILEDKSFYPENTSLQKLVKARLLEDPSDFGMGCGIFER